MKKRTPEELRAASRVEIGDRLMTAYGHDHPDHTSPNDPRWWESALCAQVGGGDEFFPESRDNRSAKKVCADCLVRDDCLREALVMRDHNGLRGGVAARRRENYMADVPDVEPDPEEDVA